MQFLYGTEFVDASEYCWPKQGRKPLQEFAESRFGTDDAKTKFLQDLRPLVERVVSARLTVGRARGKSGVEFI
jgi:predicted NUDIX family NTP pyrophosphohydrolase